MPAAAAVVADPLDEVLERNADAIASYRRRRPVVDIVNVKVWDGTADPRPGEEVRRALLRTWAETSSRLRINVSFGCVLERRGDGELRYFHSSSNNATMLARPTTVVDVEGMETFYQKVARWDLREEATRRRPDTAWKLLAVTNVTFYVYKMLGATRVGRSPRRLPERLLRRRGLLAMTTARNGRRYEDGLCFFRCLAVSLDCRCSGRGTARFECRCAYPDEARALNLYRDFCRATGSTVSWKEFEGVGVADLLLLERLFNLKVLVVRLLPPSTEGEEGSCSEVWRSPKTSGHRLVLHLYEDHFSLVTDLRRMAHCFVCESCEQSFTRYQNYTRHGCSEAEEARRKFVGGGYAPGEGVFEAASRTLGRAVPKRFYPYRMTYDIECYMERSELPESTSSVEYTAVHRLLSISLASNVPGHEKAVCYVNEGRGERDVVSGFVDGLNAVAAKASRLMRSRHGALLDEVRRVEEGREETEREAAGEEGDGASYSPVTDALERWLDVVPVVGFNSQRYDLNVLKPMLVRELMEREEEIRFVVKRENSMTCFETERCRFLDVTNYIAPGFSYEKYLKAYGCRQGKGHFPYEWVDSPERLKETRLPPRRAFDSTLRGTSLSEEDYSYCLRVWEEKGMRTFADFVAWYNNLDTEPMLEALLRQTSVYEERGIDMLKDAVSLPGLSVLWKFGFVEPSQSGPRLFGPRDAHLYTLVKKNLVGGPSIIFHRYHEADVTRLRPADYPGEEGRLCKKLLGVDANALYLYCMMMDMPVGPPRHLTRDPDTGLFEERASSGNSKTAMGWLAWRQKELDDGGGGGRIVHEGNGREVRLGARRLPVDGFDASSNTAYQFHGCFWHGHPCDTNEGVETHPVRAKPMRELLEETRRNEEYVRRLGYRLVVVWECEWRRRVNEEGRIKGFLRRFFVEHYPPSRSRFSEAALLEAVENDSFFGLVECDIRTPDDLKGRFSEMAPVFKHASVGREHTEGCMRRWLEREDKLTRPQPTLIGSTRGERVLLLSRLLRWYLAHGLVVDVVHQAVEFQPAATFRAFGESVSEARRRGDVDPDQQLLATTSKLAGNSAYGKTITNKDRHRQTSYTLGHREASSRLSSASFESMTELDEDGLYEIRTFKRKVSL